MNYGVRRVKPIVQNGFDYFRKSPLPSCGFQDKIVGQMQRAFGAFYQNHGLGKRLFFQNGRIRHFGKTMQTALHFHQHIGYVFAFDGGIDSSSHAT
jgi:hypothetical protein